MEEQPFNIPERCNDLNPAYVKAREEVHMREIFILNTLNIEAHVRSDVQNVLTMKKQKELTKK
jgi:hypothetical protein